MKAKLGIWILIGVSGLLMTGCATALIAGGAAAAGVGTVLYSKGDLETTLHSSQEEVWQACREGLQDLGLKVEKENQKPTKSILKSRQLDRKPVTLVIIPRTSKTTRLSIRVGTFGDEDASREILEAIEARL